MTTIVRATTPEQIRQVQDLFTEYIQWVATYAPAPGDVPAFAGFEQERASLPGIYAPPQGCLLLALEDLPGEPAPVGAGCVAFKRINDEMCDLKRMFVSPRFHGRQIGWHLVQRLITEAQQAGYSRMVLDSHHTMTQAHRIYEGSGFQRVQAPPDFPVALRPIVVFMELPLR